MRLYLLCVALLGSSCRAGDIIKIQPSYVPQCQIKDPEFVKCSTNSVQTLFKNLSKGIPGVISSVDPLSIKKVKLEQSGTNAANLKAELTKITVTGFKNTIVTESKVSSKDYSWETRFKFPNLHLKGYYELDGRILVVALRGNGDFFLDLENLDVVLYTKTLLYEKEGFTFYNVTSVKAVLKPGKVVTRFNNLFGGNKELEDSTNELFNESWPDFYEALRQTITETVEGIMLNVMRKVFDHVPANFFIGDIPKSSELYG